MRRGIVLPLAGLLLIAVCVFALDRPRTPGIRDGDGRTPPNSIAILRPFEIGGADQWVLIRGHDVGLPILLFLHDGPDLPLMPLAHAFQRPLEEHFVCVNWDRSGTGKSFRSGSPGRRPNIERRLSDTLELVRALKLYFGRERIILAGHGLGSHLGLLAARESPGDFDAFIGIGQVVDTAAALVLRERFIRLEAQRRHRPEAAADLDRRGPAAHEKWLFEFGGGLHRARNRRPLIRAALGSPEYTLFDVSRMRRSVSPASGPFSDDGLARPAIESVPRLEIPVYFLMGRHDRITPLSLVEAYEKDLTAPHKQIFAFDRSAHFPFIEQPETFATVLRAIRSDVLEGRRRHPDARR